MESKDTQFYNDLIDATKDYYSKARKENEIITVLNKYDWGLTKFALYQIKKIEK